MSKKKIFIASSKEAREEYAFPIARALEEAGYEVLAWWDSKAFPAGSFTLLQLIALSKEMDGAVFLFTKDDKTWYRNAEVESPRDNVVLEYGLFVSNIGPDRAVVVSDREVKIPSDMNGLGLLRSRPADSVVAHFNTLRRNEDFGPIMRARVEADPSVIALQLSDDTPKSWNSRALYIGLEGARNWMKIAEDAQYRSTQEGIAISNAVLNFCPKRQYIQSSRLDQETPVLIRR